MHTRRDTFIFLKFLALNEYRDSHTYTSSSEKPCTSTQHIRSTFTEVYRVLLRFTEVYRVLLSFTEVY